MGAILGVLFGVMMVASIAVAVVMYIKHTKGKGYGTRSQKVIGFVMLGLASVSLVMLIFIPGGFKTVNTGEVAVVKVWGEAKEVKDAGLHFANIISTEFVTYDLKTQQMDIDNEVYTKDAQPLNIKMTMQYSIKSTKEDILKINKTYGTMGALANRIQNVAVEKSKVVLSAKTAMEIIETRAKISPDVLTEIKTLETQYFINVENVVIVDMAFSTAFESAVEQKMIAEQEKLKAQYDKEKAIIKAEEELEVAKKNAEATIAKAQGNADAMIAAAEGEARALKLKSIEVARMLGFEITETVTGDTTEYNIVTENVAIEKIQLISEYLKYIAYLEAWDGQLPTVVGDGFNIMIPVNP